MFISQLPNPQQDPSEQLREVNYAEKIITLPQQEVRQQYTPATRPARGISLKTWIGLIVVSLMLWAVIIYSVGMFLNFIF